MRAVSETNSSFPFAWAPVCQLAEIQRLTGVQVCCCCAVRDTHWFSNCAGHICLIAGLSCSKSCSHLLASRRVEPCSCTACVVESKRGQCLQHTYMSHFLPPRQHHLWLGRCKGHTRVSKHWYIYHRARQLLTAICLAEAAETEASGSNSSEQLHVAWSVMTWPMLHGVIP